MRRNSNIGTTTRGVMRPVPHAPLPALAVVASCIWPSVAAFIACESRYPVGCHRWDWSRDTECRPPIYTPTPSSAVVGSIIVRTREIRFAGNPPSDACCRISSSLGAR